MPTPERQKSEFGRSNLVIQPSVEVLDGLVVLLVFVLVRPALNRPLLFLWKPGLVLNALFCLFGLRVIWGVILDLALND